MTANTDWTWAVAGDAVIASSRTDDIWFFDETAGWLVNSNGQVGQTEDGGFTWQQRAFINPSTPGFPYLRCMGWPNPRIGWIGAVTTFRSGTDYLDILLHKTVDAGATWIALKNLPEDSPAAICGLFAVSENVVFAAGTNDPNLPGPGFIKTTDGGAGVAAAEIRQHLPHCRLETISLTPIDPYLWLRPELGGLSRTPFIDRQFVGDIDPALAALTGTFDFIYDCFGPVFWHLTEAVRQDSRATAEGLLQAILNRLAPGGVLFVAASEGVHMLEKLLDRLSGASDGVVLFPPRFASTSMRICVLEKSH